MAESKRHDLGWGLGVGDGQNLRGLMSPQSWFQLFSLPSVDYRIATADSGLTPTSGPVREQFILSAAVHLYTKSLHHAQTGVTAGGTNQVCPCCRACTAIWFTEKCHIIP